MPPKHRDFNRRRDVYGYAAVGVLVASALTFRHFRLDDAFIAYRTAQHWAVGLGPVMNAGERVEGVSNLPWTGLLGLGAALGLEPHVLAPWLSCLCGLAVLALAAALAARVCGDARASGPAALICAAAAPIAIWSVSGMETLAFTALLALLFLRALGDWSSRRGGIVTGLVLGVVASMRPEGLAYAFPLVLAQPCQVRWLRGVCLGAAAVVVPVFVGRWFYYGAWVPNPVLAKVTLGSAAFTSGLLYIGKGIAAFPLFFAAVPFTCACGGRVQRLLVGWIATTMLVAWVAGGERFPGYRLWVPAWPALVLCLLVAMRRLQQGSLPRPGWIVAAMLVAATVALVLPQQAFRASSFMAAIQGQARIQRQQAPLPHARLEAECDFLGAMCFALAAGGALLLWQRREWNRAALRSSTRSDEAHDGSTPLARSAASRWVHASLCVWVGVVVLMPLWLDPSVRACRTADPAVRFGEPVGEYLRSHFDSGTWVATNCAGSLPYFARLPVIDMLGLTDAHIARAQPDRRQWIGHEKGDGAYVLSRRPHIIILGGPEGSVTPWHFPGDRQIAAAPEFQRDYALRRVVIADFEFVYYARRDLAAPRE
ncbi:MAG TPA: hypothetical protein VFD07_07185 [Candidatus Krumholzibacteria bacterium]|nr:hypothetical protein [Candidatus Krumholzibacteria bacterium]